MSASPPFGKPFKYTDTYDLPGNFHRPGTSGRYGGTAWVPDPWWKRWFKRRPKAWQVVGEDLPQLPVAYLMHEKQDPKDSEVIAPGVMPLYNETQAILDADEYERAHPLQGGNSGV